MKDEINHFGWIVLVIWIFVLTLVIVSELENSEISIDATKPDLPYGYVEECVGNETIEKYVVIDKVDKCAGIWSIISMVNDTNTKEFTLTYFTFECVDDYLNNLTKPYLEFYNETVCIKWGLVRNEIV